MNEVNYRGWVITQEHNYHTGWLFHHEDYSGPEDDCGWAKTLDEAKAEIDDLEDEE